MSIEWERLCTNLTLDFLSNFMYRKLKLDIDFIFYSLQWPLLLSHNLLPDIVVLNQSYILFHSFTKLKKIMKEQYKIEFKKIFDVWDTDGDGIITGTLICIRECWLCSKVLKEALKFQCSISTETVEVYRFNQNKPSGA